MVEINNQILEENTDTIIADALLGGDTLAEEWVTVMPDMINGKQVQIMDVDAPIGAYACDFADNGTVKFDGKTMTVRDLMVSLKYCIKDLENTWLAAKIKGSFLGKPVPAIFQDFLMERIKAKVAAQNDKLLWQGDILNVSPILNKYDGLLKGFLADGDVIDQAILAITAANSYEELMKVYAVIPNEIAFNYDTIIWYVSYDVARAWMARQGAENQIKDFGIGGRPLNFMEYRMVPIGGLPNNTVVVAEKTNLLFGTDLITDFNEIRMVDHRLTTNDDKISIRMNMRAGTLHGIGSEIVYAKV